MPRDQAVANVEAMETRGWNSRRVVWESVADGEEGFVGVGKGGKAPRGVAEDQQATFIVFGDCL
jgi:hypothetical protein